jgi:hypothetical protein
MVSELSRLAAGVVALNDQLRALRDCDPKVSEKAALALSQVNVNLISAQAAALTSERERAALLARIQDLERRIREIEDWESTAKNYALHAVFPDVWAYASPSEAGGHVHLLCPLCFAQRAKSILQRSTDGENGNAYYCLSCGTVLAQSAPGLHARRES